MSKLSNLAYRGYLIRLTIKGEVFVEKDGHLVCWAINLTQAKCRIDALLDS